MATARENGLSTSLAFGLLGAAGVGYYLWKRSSTALADVVEDVVEELPEPSVEESASTTLAQVSETDTGTTEAASDATKQAISKWWKEYRTPKGVKISAIGNFKIAKVIEPKKTLVLYANGPVPTEAITVNKGKDKIVLLIIKIQLSQQKSHEEKLYLVFKPNKVIYLGPKLLRRKEEVVASGGTGSGDTRSGGTGSGGDSRIVTTDVKSMYKACVYNIADTALKVVLSNDTAAINASPNSAPWNILAEQGQWCGYGPSDLAGIVLMAMRAMEPSSDIIEQALQLLVNKSVLAVMPDVGTSAKRNPDLSNLRSYLPLVVPAGAFFLTDKYYEHKGLLMPSVVALATYMALVTYMDSDI